MIRHFSLAAVTLVWLLAHSAQAVVVHDEALDGDLSGVFAMPDPLAIANGANTIIGQMGNNGDIGATNGQDADYVSITLGVGQSLTDITVDAYTFAPTNPGSSFLGYVEGTAFNGQAGGDVDDFILFNASSVDMLEDLAGGPLDGESTWSFWLQETSETVVDYELTFTVVPEPAGPLMLVIGGVGLLAARRRA